MNQAGELTVKGLGGPALRLLAGILLCACIAGRAQAVPAIVPAPPQLAASSYLLMDADSGKILVAENTGQRLPPASLTKIMTGYVVAEELQQGAVALDDQVYISVKAWRMEGSRMFVREGTRVTLENLLRGVIIQSGNDASVALAEHVSGSEETFVDLMNRYAERLGMTDTRYENSTGLPHDNHYTTAADLALLTRDMISRHPEHYGIYLERSFTYNEITQKNRNLLLWRDPSVDGVKTGHTDVAGFCLVASAKRGARRLISVIMNSSSVEARTQDSLKLLNYGFRYFETYHLKQAGEVMRRVRVFGGTRHDLQLGLAEDLIATLPRGSREQLEMTLDLPAVVMAPVEKGEELGTLTLSVDGSLLRRVPLQALNPVPRAGFFRRTQDSLKLFFLKFFGLDTSSVD